MIRRWSKRTKQTISAIGITLIVCSLMALIGWTVLQRQWILERAQYEREIKQLNDASLSQVEQEGTSQVWQFTRTLHAGDVIATDDIELVELETSTIPEGRVKEKEHIVGKLLKIDVSPRLSVIASMIATPGSLDHDMRWIETAVIQLPLQLKLDDVLDIRIRFPNGLDYVLIAHKKVLDLQKPTMWMHLSEQELLTLSSAYVDAYLNEGQIYAVRYIDPMLQNKAIANYPVHEDVLQLIKTDPNIVQKAQVALSEQARKILEQQLEDYRQHSTSYDASLDSAGSHSTQDSGAPGSLHYSPFTGLAPELPTQSPFIGERSPQADDVQPNFVPHMNSNLTDHVNTNDSHSNDIPPVPSDSYAEPDQSLNKPMPSIEMKTSQSQMEQNEQP